MMVTMLFGWYTGQTLPVVRTFKEDGATVYVVRTPQGDIDYYGHELILSIS